MSDAIKPPGAPGSSEDVGSRPDVGFHDDHVGSHLKAEEAAKRRASHGVMQRRPRRIDLEPEQVGEVRHPRHTQEDPARELGRQQRGLVAGRGPQKQKATSRRPGGVPPAVDQDVRRIEERVDMLMGTLVELEDPAGAAARQGQGIAEGEPAVLALVTEEEREALEEAKARAQGRSAYRAPSREANEVGRHRRVEADQHGDGHGHREQQSTEEDARAAAEELETEADEARWQRAARDMRFLLQHLIAGGIGVTLGSDPDVTFRRLFDGLAAWPARVPPGHRPQSGDDYDAFLSWVFRPDDASTVLHELTTAESADEHR